MCACRSSLISDICDVKQCMARPVPLTRKIYLFDVIFFGILVGALSQKPSRLTTPSCWSLCSGTLRRRRWKMMGGAAVSWRRRQMSRWRTSMSKACRVRWAWRGRKQQRQLQQQQSTTQCSSNSTIFYVYFLCDSCILLLENSCSWRTVADDTGARWCETLCCTRAPKLCDTCDVDTTG